MKPDCTKCIGLIREMCVAKSIHTGSLTCHEILRTCITCPEKAGCEESPEHPNLCSHTTGEKINQILLQGVSLKNQPLKNILEIILFDAEQQGIEIKGASYNDPTPRPSTTKAPN